MIDENEYCEVCSGNGAHGLSLCERHLDEWLRSPERRRLVNVNWDDEYQEALDRFVERKTGKKEASA